MSDRLCPSSSSWRAHSSVSPKKAQAFGGGGADGGVGVAPRDVLEDGPHFGIGERAKRADHPTTGGGVPRVETGLEERQRAVAAGDKPAMGAVRDRAGFADERVDLRLDRPRFVVAAGARSTRPGGGDGGG